MKEQEKKLILIDFDCTLSITESFDYYVEKYRSEFLDEFKTITEAIYSGELPFLEALCKKLNLLKPKQEHFKIASIDIFQNTIDKIKLSFLKELAEKNKDFVTVKIASGGIKDLISHTAAQAGFDILSVELDYDKDGNYLGIQDNGFQISKEEGVRRLLEHSKYSRVLLLGDGMNDYEVYKAGLVDTFVHYTEFRANGLEDVQEKYSQENGFLLCQTARDGNLENILHTFIGN